MQGMSGFSRTRVNWFYLPAEKRSTLKRKNLLPVGANSFLLEQTSFPYGLWYAVKQKESHKSCLPCTKSTKCVNSPWRPIWTTPCENVSSGICRKPKPRSDCTYSLDQSILNSRVSCYFLIINILLCVAEISIFNANSGDPDQMPHSATSDLGMHFLPMTLLGFSD